MFGFNSVDEYYSTAKLVDKVHLIRTPVFALHADDDPIAPGWSTCPPFITLYYTFCSLYFTCFTLLLAALVLIASSVVTVS